MKTFEMDCFEVTESYDRDTTHIAFVSSRSLAISIQQISKAYRSVKEYKKTITIFDTMEEVEANTVNNIRKSALAKLTPKEREVLGL